MPVSQNQTTRASLNPKLLAASSNKGGSALASRSGVMHRRGRFARWLAHR
jgi:hypothetical protein